ncbi:hypothetical protein [Roseateles sp.]|uniref:hypothetical protein n=1 Tax=Roseateles sp. TaxID=1971397 RepID=UPI003BAD2674
MLHTVLAVLGLVTCIALAVHMALPWRARNRVDAGLARLSAWAQRQMDRATGWRRRQRQTRAAALEAERVIRRAREATLHEQGRRAGGEWDGNVYRPKRFEKPKKPH